MSGHLLLDVIVGLVVVAGIVGSLIQIIPGLLLAGAGVIVWGLATGSTVGLTVAAITVLIVAVGTAFKYALAGRYLKRTGVPGRSILVGGVFGVIGFFVIPIVGLIVGFVIGTWFAELQRLKDTQKARTATIAAMKATGISVLVELAVTLAVAMVWVTGLVVH